MKIFSAALVFLPVFASPSFGAVPPDVVSVTSGGYWDDGEKSGTYRVVISNKGFEHITSTLLIEWIADPADRDGSPVVAGSVEPSLPFGQGVSNLRATLSVIEPNHVEVKVLGTMASDLDHEVSATIYARSPNEVEVK